MDEQDGGRLRGRLRDALVAARVSEPSLGTSSLPDPGALESIVDELLARHDDPGRRHHGRRHLAEVLAEVDRLVELDQRWWQVPSTVELAVLFHDVVYDPARDDNEQRSADLAEAELAEVGIGPSVRQEVARLVRLTTTHEPADEDPPGQLLVDGDLWILATPRDRYDRYVHEVRAEYDHLDDRQWRAGRIEVLDRLAGLLDRRGYRVGPRRDRDGRRVVALDNVAWERARLADGSDGEPPTG